MQAATFGLERRNRVGLDVRHNELSVGVPESHIVIIESMMIEIIKKYNKMQQQGEIRRLYCRFVTGMTVEVDMNPATK